MIKKISFFLFCLMIFLLCTSCGGSEEITTEKSSEKIEKTTENVEITTEKIENTSESESIVMTEATEVTTAPIEIDDWYVKEGSVQIEFELGEKFNYNDIVVIHEVNGEKTEYPEDDIYVEHEPELTLPGEYVVSVEVLPEEIIMTYTITVKDIDIAKVFEKAPTLSLGEEKSIKLEIEDIDLSHINSNGKLIVDDEYASGKKYVQNYGKIGNCFGFKISSDKNIEGAKIVLRMANFAVTMIYPAENIALYQNYVSIEKNTRIEFDPNYYLTTRAPSMDGQSGADTSLVWCEVVLENITLNEGENSFMLAVIGKEAPFLDCIEIIVP